MATQYMRQKAHSYPGFIESYIDRINAYTTENFEIKDRFLKDGRSILKALAKDLELTESKVWINKAGFGVAGDVMLMGMWKERGIYVDFGEPALHQHIPFVYPLGTPAFMYRSIKHMEDYTGGRNQWLSFHALKEWDSLVDKLKEVNYLFVA